MINPQAHCIRSYSNDYRSHTYVTAFALLCVAGLLFAARVHRDAGAAGLDGGALLADGVGAGRARARHAQSARRARQGTVHLLSSYLLSSPILVHFLFPPPLVPAIESGAWRCATSRLDVQWCYSVHRNAEVQSLVLACRSGVRCIGRRRRAARRSGTRSRCSASPRNSCRTSPSANWPSPVYE